MDVNEQLLKSMCSSYSGRDLGFSEGGGGWGEGGGGVMHGCMAMARGRVQKGSLCHGTLNCVINENINVRNLHEGVLWHFAPFHSCQILLAHPNFSRFTQE